MKTFNEQYLVKLNYRKPDGFWVFGHVEDILVTVEHGKNEKNNHSKAERKALEMYPNCEIVCVTYC